MKLKPSSKGLLGLGTAVFLFYFVVKCLHFERSDYTSDIFSHFQLSRDWLIGKPLFYENSFGFHCKFHNYFIDPLLGVFTYFFSAYGLFIALFLGVIASLYAVIKLMEQREASFQSILLFVLIYTSPLSYFVFHNEHFGFHAEMLLVPLGLLFLASFLQNSRWYWLWAFLIILVKEDAVVVLWSIWVVIEWGKLHHQEINWKQFVTRFVSISAMCGLVLMAGMTWLRYQNNWGETRSGMLFQTFNEVPLADIMASIQYLLLQRIQLTIGLLILIYLYSGWRFTLGVMLFSIPILALNFLSGLLYSLDGGVMIKNYFSLLWSPRLSMYWAYWLCVLAVSLMHSPRIIIYPKGARTLACLLFGWAICQFQITFFKNCYVTRFSIGESIGEVFGPNIEFGLNPEFADAASIAKQLPAHYPVAPMYRVFGAFHKQDLIWLNAYQNAYYAPRMILASYNKDEIPDVSSIMKHPLHMVYKEKLFIYTEAEDTVYVSRAGIHGEWTEIETEEGN